MSFDPAFFLILPAFVLSVVVHECAHGLVALWNGDPTARDRGRLTLNPIPHVDPVGSLLLPLALALFRSPVVLGWARPVPITGEARVTQLGKTVAFAEGKLMAEDGTVLVTGSTSIRLVDSAKALR